MLGNLTSRFITLDPFCFPLFEKRETGGIYIEFDRDEFTKRLNELYATAPLVDGYAPFCKHIFCENFTPAVQCVLAVTPELEPLIKYAALPHTSGAGTRHAESRSCPCWGGGSSGRTQRLSERRT